MGCVLLIVGIAYCLAAAVAVLGFGLAFDLLLFLLGYFMIGSGIVVFMLGRASRCPHCRRHFAMREVGNEIVAKRSTTKEVERERRDEKGRVIGHYSERVPATCYIYDYTEECRFCGAHRKIRRGETYRNYID